MSSSSFGDTYYIQQVAQITGIQKALIRKWESRYHIIEPKRLDNGYRVYNEQDINRLLLMKSYIESGSSAKQAAELALQQDLSQLQQSKPASFEQLNEYVLHILEKGTKCEEQDVHLILQQAYFHFGLEQFLQQVVIPLLKEVGHRWEKKQWSEYQESLVSIIVRDFLVQIRRSFLIKKEAPCVLGACLPGELHEIPLHILLLQCTLQGYRTYLVGSSPAPGSIEALIKEIKPTKVLLSASTTIPFETHPDLIQKLDDFAGKHSDIDFCIGGAGTIEFVNPDSLTHLRMTETFSDIFLTHS